jgi:hypothetical protein
VHTFKDALRETADFDDPDESYSAGQTLNKRGRDRPGHRSSKGDYKLMRVRGDRKDVQLTAAYIVALGVALSVAQAASLKPEAAKAWEDYIENASAGIQERANAPVGFLQIDATPAVAAKVHRGQIVVSPAAAHIPKKVPSGLIHDWIGAAFLANTTIKDVVAIVRDYPKYTEVYAPHVLEARVISTSETADLFSVVLINKSVLSKTALDCDYETTFVRVDGRRMYSITQAKRIQEIADYGTAKQHALPEGEGTGLIWRLFSVSRFEEREDGLYIETEAMALSRDIPSALRLVVEPIVRRVSREALETALRQTANAAHASGAAAAVRAAPLQFVPLPSRTVR